MKYLDLTGLETVVNNVLSHFQQTFQLDINILNELMTYDDGDNVTGALSFENASALCRALIDKKNIVINGGNANAFIPVSAAWGVESAASFEFGIAVVTESYDEFTATKIDLSANKSNNVVTLTHIFTKVL